MPSLRFAPYREIASEIAARLAAARLGRDPLAPWEEEVIVPSRGAAEAIAAELLTRLPHGIAGLRLQSLDELAKRIVAGQNLTPRVATDAERRLAMRIAVRSIDDSMMSSRGIAAMLERSYRDVRDSGFTLADFTRRAGGVRGLRNPRRTETVIRAWTEYERLVGQLGAIDPADLLGRATRAVDARVPRQLLAGFYDMTGAQRQLTEALLRAERVGAIWVPSEAPFAEPFIHTIAPYCHPEPAKRGEGPPALCATGANRTGSFAVSAAQDDSSSAQLRMTASAYNTRLDELRDVCSRVARLLADGTAAREIGIVARSFEPYDTSLLNRFAAEHGFATTLGETIPLSAHRIGRGALTLLRLRDRGFPRSEVLCLVRDGLHAKTRVDVDAADRETRRARIAGGTSEELLRMRSRPPVIDGYIALVSELEEMTLNVDLARLGSLFRIETEADLLAAEKLDTIAALFERIEGHITADVIDAIENESIPRQPPTVNRQPVWAGEVLRFRGRSFSHLFVVRMQDEVFPQRRTEDPLLPESDRRLVGIREIGDGRDEEQLLFSLLADSTSSQVHYSFASGDGFGKVLRRSRFVRGVERESRSAGILPAAPPASLPACRLEGGVAAGWKPALRETARQLQLIAKAGTRSVFDGYIGPIALDKPLSPTQLEDFGECPQKFLLKHVLGVQDVDHPERELQIHHRDKGILDHRVLERFYREMSEEEIRAAAASLPRLPERLEARLEQLIDEQFDDHERDVPPFNRTVRDIERRATKRILREFVVSDLADLDARDLVPRWFEFRFGTKFKVPADHPHPFIIETAGVPVRVEGTIDRIDTSLRVDESSSLRDSVPSTTRRLDDPATRYRIVDYKSGKALRHVNLGDKIDRGVRLQLALYAMAVAEIFRADPAHVSGTIKPLVVDEKPEKFAFVLAEKRAALLETLEIFIRAIVHGEFPAFPNANDAEFNSCKYCPVNHSCRTKHDLDERYAVQQLKDPRTLLGGGL
ncbi:MAG: PD-(D/E)XK nuclease family protein [Thermoanaerobaculia bacterium]